jgi:hypothetical protein
MGAQVFGSGIGTAFLYGIDGTVTNGAVQSFKAKGDFQNTATVEDEFGNQIERRYDDLADEGTLELKYRSAYTIPVPGTVFAWAGGSWELLSVEKNQGGKQHRMLTLAIKKSQYINSSTVTTVVTST